MRKPDAIALLTRALNAGARVAGLRLEVRDARSRSWASATFIGERVELVLSITGTGGAGWLAGLPDADLPMRGWYVADLEIRGAELRALLLQDA
ncbi:hypothetical protein [Sphingomonas lenta]|uniref:Uncharacterized protein n=1 Tax=Sphingomonas lenta TaxID=1141887 RepID=A0A2A2SKD9_9SPHN|nr:hypothetical protein [Sphingomonas lenta]PAX09716.1 hypothetical protein CKY28_03015 [Sphingomonas lenta]